MPVCACWPCFFPKQGMAVWPCNVAFRAQSRQGRLQPKQLHGPGTTGKVRPRCLKLHNIQYRQWDQCELCRPADNCKLPSAHLVCCMSARQGLRGVQRWVEGLLQLQNAVEARPLVDPGVAAKDVAHVCGQMCHLNMPAFRVTVMWAAGCAPHHARQELDLHMLQAVTPGGGRAFSMRQSSRSSGVTSSVGT